MHNKVSRKALNVRISKHISAIRDDTTKCYFGYTTNNCMRELQGLRRIQLDHIIQTSLPLRAKSRWNLLIVQLAHLQFTCLRWNCERQRCNSIVSLSRRHVNRKKCCYVVLVRACSHGPGNRAGPLSGINFSCVHMVVYRDEIWREILKTNMAHFKHSLVVLVVVNITTLVLLLM